MAGISSYFEPDLANGRILIGWTQDGIVHKTNVLLPGSSRIVLHRHSYGHTFKIKSGSFRLTDIPPGAPGKFSYVGPGDELFMPKWHEHAFDRIDGGSEPGVIDCFWPEGADQ